MFPVNTSGTPANLVPATTGNTNAVRHGVYSPRSLEPRAQEVTEAIMSAAHTIGIDEVGAQEIGRLVALVEAIDADIAENGLTRKGDARTIVKLRLQASRRLQEWLSAYGMTPKGRAEFVQSLARGKLVAEIARRRQESA
jgi:hypothetical protein